MIYLHIATIAEVNRAKQRFTSVLLLYEHRSTILYFSLPTKSNNSQKKMQQNDMTRPKPESDFQV